MHPNIAHCELFKGLSSIDMENVITDFQAQTKYYQKGETIVFSFEAVYQQLILLEGEVKTEMQDYSGKTIKIADMKATRLLAPAFLFGNESLFPVSIIAKSNCSVLAIQKKIFQKTLLKYSQLQINFLRIISNQTQFLTRKINFLQFRSIKGKIAHLLLKQSSLKANTEIELQQSMTQLADLFGVARPSLSRAFGELQKDGIILQNKNKIKILDLNALKEYLG